MSSIGDGPLLPYERSEGRFMGRLSEAQGGGYRLEYFDDGKPPGSPLRLTTTPQTHPQSHSRDETGRGGGEDESSAYGGVKYRDSLGTLDGQRWIDEYTQRRETSRRSEGEVSVMIRPLSHKEV